MQPTPVILDTDIGDDIDDTWALIQLLKSPELDLRLVTTAFRDTLYRARLVAKLLSLAGRTHIPLGIGTRQEDAANRGRQEAWVAGYALDRFPGTVHHDGVQALIDVIRLSPTPITLIAIGPLPNIAEALRRAPDIAPKTRFVGMHGAVFCGYNGHPPIDAEWNVRADPASAKTVFAAPWREMILTPLDSCGKVRLRGVHYQAVKTARDPATQAIIANYRAYSTGHNTGFDVETESSVLFDTVAVHLAHSTRWLELQTINLRITDDGFTRPDPAGRPVQVATAWTDLPAFETDLTRRLTAWDDSPAEARPQTISA